MKPNSIVILRVIFFLWLGSAINCYGQVHPEVKKFRELPGRQFEKGNVFKNWVTSFYMDGNNMVWASSGNLLYRFDGINTTIVATHSDPTFYPDRTFEISDTLYTFHRDHSTYHVPLDLSKTTFEKSRWNFKIVGKTELGSGLEIIATDDGQVLSYKNGILDTLYQYSEKIQNTAISYYLDGIIADKNDPNKIWFYFDNTLVHIDAVSRQYEMYPDVSKQNTDFPMPKREHVFLGLYQDDTAVYMGSLNQGLKSFDLKDNSWSIHTYPLENKKDQFGQIATQIIEISPDYLLVLPFSQYVYDKKSKQYIGFDKSNFYLDRLIGGLGMKKDGNYFINNHSGGISVLTESSDKKVIPYVSHAEVLDKPHYYEYNSSNRLELSPDEDYFSIYYSALSFEPEDNLSFEYMLEGFDDDWQKGKKNMYVSYNRLPPGEYSFRVRTTQNGQVTESKQDNLSIRIKAEWYESVLFRLALGLLFAGLIYTLYKYRVNNIRREERIKSEYSEQLARVKLEALRSQMNPHFIFNCLNSIDNFILNNDPVKASEYLSKFSKLIRKILEFSKTNSISLRDELEFSEIYLKMEQKRFSNKFDYRIDIEETVVPDHVTIPPLILQPYIENAIWHGLLHKSSDGQLDIRVRRINDQLIIEIEDDGIGRKKAEEIKLKSAVKRKSFGMKITKERIELINDMENLEGAIETIDNVDECGNATGTTVRITFSYSKLTS